MARELTRRQFLEGMLAAGAVAGGAGALAACGAPAPTAPPAIVAPSCPDGRAVIVEPGAGQQINGPVGMIGTAQSANFEYYKIEFKPAGAPGDFSFYLRRDSPVINGPLGTWNPAGLPPGEYLLRLVTVDVTGNFGQCAVQVNVGG